MFEVVSFIINVLAMIVTIVCTIITCVDCKKPSASHMNINNLDEISIKTVDIQQNVMNVQTITQSMKNKNTNNEYSWIPTTFAILYILVSLVLTQYILLLFVIMVTISIFTLISLWQNKSTNKAECIIIILCLVIVGCFQMFFAIAYNDNRLCMLFCATNLLMIITYEFIYSLIELINHINKIVKKKKGKNYKVISNSNNKKVQYSIIVIISGVCIIMEYIFRYYTSDFLDNVISVLEKMFSI